jgi:hypothetical protein
VVSLVKARLILISATASMTALRSRAKLATYSIVMSGNSV